MADGTQLRVNAGNVVTAQAAGGTRLDGAAAIAAYIKKPERWVYQARERGWRVPIRKADGLGIYAFAEELDAWQRDPSTLCWSPDAAGA